MSSLSEGMGGVTDARGSGECCRFSMVAWCCKIRFLEFLSTLRDLSCGQRQGLGYFG